MDRSVLYVICAVAFGAMFLHKLRRLRTRWASPRLWGLCVAIFFTGVTMWLSAPANHYLVARATGVANFAMLLIGASHAVAASAFLALALLWRYSARAAWLRLRWILAACALSVVAMIVLFSVSSLPEERTADFAIHYAGQPTVAAFVMIWWVCVLIGHTMTAYWCFTWARHPDYADLRWLRWSLRLYGTASADVALFGLVGIASVSAHWLGSSVLDPVYTTAPPILASVGALMLAAALTAPTWGRRLPVVVRWLSGWRTFFLIRSLHRALRHVEPTLVFVARGRWLDPDHRTRRMMIELSDWRWILAPLFNPAVGDAAHRLGREAQLSPDDLATTVEAAQLKAAARAWRQGGRSAAENEAKRHALQGESARDGAIDAEVTWWVQVAGAYRQSAIVTNALSHRPGVSAPHYSGVPELPH